MAARSPILISAAICCLFLLLTFPCQTEATRSLRDAARRMQLMHKICKQSPNFHFCAKILLSNLNPAVAANVKTVAQNALDMAKKESQSTSHFFYGLVNGKDTNSAYKPALENCASYFDKAVMFLNLKGLEGDTASLDVHGALDNAQYCENALSTGNVHISTVPGKLEESKNFFSVAEAAVTALEGESSQIDESP